MYKALLMGNVGKIWEKLGKTGKNWEKNIRYYTEQIYACIGA